MRASDTLTIFGGNRELIEGLEDLLRDKNLPKHNALVMGAGLAFVSYEPYINDVVQQPWLQQKYSWEYLEVAAMLKRLGKPWTVTVLDSSREVCDHIQSQTKVIVDDWVSFGNDQAMTAYAQRFLDALGDNYNDEAEINEVNAALRSKGEKELNVFKIMEIPVNLYPNIGGQIRIVQGGIENLGGLTLPCSPYDIITVVHTLTDVRLEKQKVDPTIVNLLSKEGILASDFPTNGLVKVNPPGDIGIGAIYQHP